MVKLLRLVILPTQIESTVSSQTEVTQVITDTVIDDLIQGELEPTQEQAIIEQITDLKGSMSILFTGQINVNETIKFLANHSSTSGVTVTYDWSFSDGKQFSGKDKQYVSHSFSKAGQYTAQVIISSSTGTKFTVTKTLNVIPEPLSYGDVKISAVSNTDRVIINVQNNINFGINGSINISAKGSNYFTKNYNMYINPKGTGQHVLSSQNSGSTTYSISYRPNGSSKALDNLTKTLNISGSVSTPTCTISNTVKSILNSLKYLKYPSWFEIYITKVKVCEMTESAFISTYNSALSNGFITINAAITQLNINGPGNVYLYMNDPFFVWEPYRLHPATGALFYPWVGNPALYYTGAWHGDPTGAISPAKVHQPEACFAIQTIDYNAARKSYEVIGIWLCGETIQGDTQHFQWSLNGPFADGDDDADVDGLGYTEITASFSEDSKGWTSFKSWLQQTGVSINDKYFTFSGGELYQHHDNDVRNNFYGSQYTSTFCVLFNDMPSSVKNFSSLSYEGSQSKIDANLTDGEYYNNIAKTGWFAESIITDLETGQIPEFKEKEGKWFNFIRGNKVNNLANLNVKQFSTQGIGRLSAIAVTVPAPAVRNTLTVQDVGDID